MSYSAQDFPRVLELDPDRGVHGLFCPWPPLYDLAAGGAARLFGATDDAGVLARVIWFPPVLFAAFVAATVFCLTRAFGAAVAVIAGIALAASPFLVMASWVASIDHHFLEPALTFAILGTALSASVPGAGLKAGLPFALALTAAMFVQTALVIAAGLAFAVIFIRDQRRAGAMGFAIAAVAIAAYRLTRAAAYPGNAWFLGWTHVALFVAAAVALFARPRILGLILGVMIVAPFATSIVAGTHFFGGDPWLRTILEFEPVWRARGEDLLSIAVGLGAGAVLVWPLLVRRRNANESAIALFAIVYLALTIASRRFWIVAIPLLALAGAVYAGKRVLLALLIALPPPLQLAGWMTNPAPIPTDQRAWVAAAEFLRTQPPGRVLAPWSMGHAVDVLGHHAVIIDNFGTMPDPELFWRANGALSSRDPAELSRFCTEAGVRYVVRERPLRVYEFRKPATYVQRYVR